MLCAEQQNDDELSADMFDEEISFSSVPRRAISGGFRRDKFGSGRVDSGGVAQSVMWLES